MNKGNRKHSGRHGDGNCYIAVGFILRQLQPNNTSGGSRGRKGRAPPGPKFLHFHAVFGKNWSNSKLALPSGVGVPIWEILDPPLNAEVLVQ